MNEDLAGNHKIRHRLIFFSLLFFMWCVGLRIIGTPSPFWHDPIDQHTRQAYSWLQGRIDIIYPTPNLELAEYQGKFYNSFPPAPTFFEIPLLKFFGHLTPNIFVLFCVTAMAAFCIVHMAICAGYSQISAYLISLTFIFGTNIYNSLSSPGVWGIGQVHGFSFAVFALYFSLVAKRFTGLSYFCLAFAVGCRPFYFFLFPVLILIDFKKRSFIAIARDLIIFGSPLLLFYSAYNYIRFGNIAEFGHTYLPYAQQSKLGLFNWSFVPRNLYHSFLHLPKPHPKMGLQFHGYGTAFWLNNPIFIFGIYALVKSKLTSLQKTAAFVVGAIIWTSLLLHISNGWYQFGYRYLIDLLPLAVMGIVVARNLIPQRVLVLLFIYSVAINTFGIWWFKNAALQ